jgi:hypothetical protein
MQFIPMRCGTCWRFSLEPISRIDRGMAACACGNTAQALPGECYGPTDRELFDIVVKALETADVGWTNATQLLGMLDEREFQLPGEALTRLTTALPSLASAELSDITDPATARKAEGMFALLLDSISSQRSQSGISPASAPDRALIGDTRYP